MMMEKLRVLDLFSGIGAYALGMQRAGFSIVGFCEIDEWCQRLLQQNFPEVPTNADIRDVDFARIEADVIIGGFPCQDISRAGKRAGIAGARSGLFWELVRGIRVVRPICAVLENVAGLLDRGGGMGVVLGALAEERYDAEWDSISLDELGAPHGRPRVWIAATDSDRTEWADGGGEAVRRRERSEKEGSEVAADCYDANAREGAAVSLSRRERVPGRRSPSPANPHGIRKLQSPWVFRHVRRWIRDGDAGAIWACDWQAKFEALRGMDVRAPTRLERARDSRSIGHIGNANPPQIPELIGRAILQSMKAA